MTGITLKRPSVNEKMSYFRCGPLQKLYAIQQQQEIKYNMDPNGATMYTNKRGLVGKNIFLFHFQLVKKFIFNHVFKAIARFGFFYMII